MKNNILNNKNIAILFLLAVSFLSCNKDDDTIEIAGISEEIKGLIYFKGSQDADTVIINAQGGPVFEFFNNDLDDMTKGIDTKNILRVNIHLNRIQDPTLFLTEEITFDKAIEYDKKSVEALAKVVKYFKNKNKKVYVLGTSFGAFMVQELIAENGIDIADAYLIMVGRLDINEPLWKGFSEGKTGHFENGVTPILIEKAGIKNKNTSKLIAGLGKNRYTQKLNKYNDLSKITYAFGKKDEAFGKLSDAEITFLNSKKATILDSNEGHLKTVDLLIKEGFKIAFNIE